MWIPVKGNHSNFGNNLKDGVNTIEVSKNSGYKAYERRDDPKIPKHLDRYMQRCKFTEKVPEINNERVKPKSKAGRKHLTLEDIRYILTHKDKTNKELGKKFNLNRTTIGRVKKGERYKEEVQQVLKEISKCQDV